VILRRIRRERSVLEILGPDAEHDAVFSPLGEEGYALGLETIYEGYLVHYGSPRLFAPADADTDDDSLEAKYKRRYPQPTKVGHLIGLPVLDDNDVTLGHVQKVVRTPEGKIELIVSYSKWFGWFGRPVAVPLEAVVILALQLDSVEMQPEDYAEAPTWSEGKDQVLADDDIVRVALGRR
jgi:hypothetical protein